MEDLSKVLATNPERDTAHAYRASELTDLGLHTLALQDYTTAIKDVAGNALAADVDNVAGLG